MLLENTQTFAGIVDRLLAPLDDPGSRLFHLNLVMTLAFVVVYLFVQSLSRGEFGRKNHSLGFRIRFRVFLRSILRRRYWWNRSTKGDYAAYVLNTVLKVFLFLPFLDLGFYFSQVTVRGLLTIFGDFAAIPATTSALLLFTVFSFVWDDFLRFFHHLVMHRVPWLWSFHSVHHSARVLTPLTLYRTHPVEAALATLRNGLSLGVSTGLFLFLFDGRFSLVTFLGVNIFGLAFNFLGANLRHSHIRISFGFFEWIFISPLQHQVHHSRNPLDRDRNFGVSLALWDLFFGTLVRSRDIGERKLSFGLSGAFDGRVSLMVFKPFSELFLNTVSSFSQHFPNRSMGLSDSAMVVNNEFKEEKHMRKFAKLNSVSTMLVAALVSGASLTALLTSSVASAALTVYTDRPTARLQPIADEFTLNSGEKVVIVELAYPKLLAQLKSEGATSPADVIFVKDIVYLAELSNQGFFQPMSSTQVEQSIAPQMRDPKLLWTAITIRGRTLVYETTRVRPEELKGYEDLALPKWAGRLCLRTSQSAYNEALVAGLIETHGLPKATSIVGGWVQNLADEPMANDTLVLEALANGICDVGIVNTYYLGQMLAKQPTFPVKAFFADQFSSGVFGNGTGAGVAATSKQKNLATKFIELMLSDKNQVDMSSAHFDYPAKLGLLPTTLVKDWGTFNFNTVNWTVVGSRVGEARDVIKAAQYK